tara:strand:+ start:193 stop:1155 length:963 start_codon:yes stop_codon:yes gene_type:complete
MKQLLTILCLVLLVSCSTEPPPDGPFESYYPSTIINDNGQLMQKGHYKNGKVEGLLETYYKNGQLESRANYKNGEPYGPFEMYYDNGQLEWRGIQKKWKLEGLHEGFHENGKLKESANYKNGKEDGLWENYYDNGQLESRGTYKDGELDGQWESYFENGQLKEKGNYKDGIAITLFKPNPSEIGLKCIKNDYEEFWIINVDDGYVIKKRGMQKSYDVERINYETRTKIKRSSVSHIGWTAYKEGSTDLDYKLNRETLKLASDNPTLCVTRCTVTWSCEIITTLELEEIRLIKLKKKSTLLEAEQRKKEKEDAEQRKRNKL